MIRVHPFKEAVVIALVCGLVFFIAIKGFKSLYASKKSLAPWTKATKEHQDRRNHASKHDIPNRKIKEITGGHVNELWALCEDGSLWLYDHHHKHWIPISGVPGGGK